MGEVPAGGGAAAGSTGSSAIGAARSRAAPGATGAGLGATAVSSLCTARAESSVFSGFRNTRFAITNTATAPKVANVGRAHPARIRSQNDTRFGTAGLGTAG
jgi:hypothetical protein